MNAPKHEAARAANLDFGLAILRMEAVAHRTRNEGLTPEVAAAAIQATWEISQALRAIDAARYATQFHPDVYRFIDGGAP